MEIGSFDHKGLRRLYESDDPSKVDAAAADKLRLMLAFLQDMGGVDELKVPPNWGAHQLTGDRKGVWSLKVTRSWRLTFRIDGEGALQNLNLEDYHS
jgi:proteic killer suppression protein